MRHTHPNRNVLSVRIDGDAKAGTLAVRAALREYDPGMFVVARILQSWIDQVTEVIGVSTFLDRSRDAKIIFI